MKSIFYKFAENLLTLIIGILLVIVLISLPKVISLTDFYNGTFKAFYSNFSRNISTIELLFKSNGVLYGEDVYTDVITNLIRSYKLVFFAFMIAIVFGVIKGVVSFNIAKQDTSLFQLLQTLFILSIPDVLLIVIFRRIVIFFLKNYHIKLLPVIGYVSFKHAILPAITLSVIPTVYIARAVTTALSQIYKKDYMLVAKGKGLSQTYILVKHAVRNCLNTIIDATISGFSMIMSSLLIVELFYYYPGIGIAVLKLYKSKLNSVIIIYGLLIGVIYVLINLLFSFIKYHFNPEKQVEIVENNG